LQAAESKFKFTFGSKIGGIPFELNKMSKDIKTLQGIKINSWIFTPNFSSFLGDKKLFNFSNDKISNDKIYLKFNIKF
jgi:hypothetical protein